MVSVEEALDIILQHTPVLDSEEVPLSQAMGRVLAEDIHALEDIPSGPRSAVDGYAVRSDDTSPQRRVTERVTAGHTPVVPVSPGTAVQVMTGVLLPEGADAVVMVEDTRELDQMVLVQRRVQPWENVHRPGQDLAAGQRILERGAIVGPAETGILATVGRVRVPVHRRPRVGVLATGDELVEVDQVPPPGSVRDSNRHALVAAAAEAGAAPISLGIVRDVEREQRERIRLGLEQVDVLVTSGGVSMGTRDLIKPILEELGRVHFGRVNFKPGKPLTFATVGSKLVFGLPGFPVSSLVTFEVFVRPALRKMQGHTRLHRPRVQVLLEHEVRPDPGRPEYQRAIVSWHAERGCLTARTTGLQSSSRLMSMVGANALLLIPAGDRPLPAGQQVDAVLVGEIE